MGIFRRPSTKQVKPKNDERSKKVLTEEDLAKMTVFEREKYEERIIQDAKSVELRKEFEQENEVLSFAELHSWFGYDFANSVYSSAVVSMFMPLLLSGLAKWYACPYEDFPVYVNENLTDYKSLGGDIWDGWGNKTTTCTLQPEIMEGLKLEGEFDVSASANYWANQLGSGDMGFPSLEKHVQTVYDSNLEESWIEDNIFLTGDLVRPFVDCDDFVGDFKYEALLNITVLATYEGGDVESPHGDASSTYYVTPIEASESAWNVPACGSDPDSGKSHGEACTESVYLEIIESTNPFIVTASNETKITPYNITSGGQIGFEVGNNMWYRGATTLTVRLTDTINNKTGLFDFTVVAFDIDTCPIRVPFLFFFIRPITFAALCSSMGVLLQALLFFTVAAFGDYGPWRKLLLSYFSMIGSLTTSCMFMCYKPERYIYAGMISIISNVFYGASQVMYSSYLPYIARCHKRFLDAKFDYKNVRNAQASGVGAASKKLLDTYLDVQDEISSDGYFWGYVSGSVVVAMSIVYLFIDSSFVGITNIVSFCGLWWFVFAIPTYVFVQVRPGPPFPDELSTDNALKNLVLAMSFSWRRIFAGMAALTHIPHTLRFLMAFFFYSDGYNTCANVAILFGSDELGMTTTELAILAAQSPFFGAIGMKTFRWHQVTYGTATKRMLMTSLFGMMFVPWWGIIGLIPGMPFGLMYKNELYLVCVIYGMCLGPVQSYSRTMFTDLIPPGRESEYFGVFEISDRGSSWIGPAITAILYEITGSMRIAMSYIAAVLAFGFFLLYRTDPKTGADDCRRKEVIIRMQATREKWGVMKNQAAPASTKKFLGLKSSMMSSKSGRSSMKSTNSSAFQSAASTASSVEGSSRKSSMAMFRRSKAQSQQSMASGFDGATVVEEEDKDGFDGKTVVEDTDGASTYEGATMASGASEMEASTYEGATMASGASTMESTYEGGTMASSASTMDASTYEGGTMASSASTMDASTMQSSYEPSTFGKSSVMPE